MAAEEQNAPVVIAVAITGSVPRKKDNPALPVTVAEQIESTQQAFEAGATLAHIHVRNDDESPSSDPDRFAAVQEGLRRHCPGMIVAILDRGAWARSVGARPFSQAQARHGLAVHRLRQLPDDRLRESGRPRDRPRHAEKANGVRPEIEIFDLSHLHGARRLIDAGLMDERPHVQFVMGVQNAMPADPVLLDILLAESRRVLPKATWTAAGIGRNQATVMDWALARGADAVRTGLEDNIRIAKDRLAASNAELVSLAAEAVSRHGRRVATPAEARAKLGLAT